MSVYHTDREEDTDKSISEHSAVTKNGHLSMLSFVAFLVSGHFYVHRVNTALMRRRGVLKRKAGRECCFDALACLDVIASNHVTLMTADVTGKFQVTYVILCDGCNLVRYLHLQFAELAFNHLELPGYNLPGLQTLYLILWRNSVRTRT